MVAKLESSILSYFLFNVKFVCSVLYKIIYKTVKKINKVKLELNKKVGNSFKDIKMLLGEVYRFSLYMKVRVSGDLMKKVPSATCVH